MVTTRKQFSWRRLVAWLILASCCTPFPVQAADTTEPVAVLSIASVDRLMSDFVYLTHTAGRPDIGGLVQMLSASFVEDLDRRRPAGVLIVMEDGQPKGVGFLPIPDLTRVLTKIQDRFAAEVEPVGGDVQRLDLGQGIFLKKQGSWVFFSDEARHLARLPADPTQLLEGLNEDYVLSARIFVQNVPLPIRQYAVARMQAAARADLLETRTTEDPIEREFSETLQAGSMAAVKEMFDHADQITVGWSIDGQAQKTHLDVAITALEASALGQQMNRLSEVQSSHAGFLLPDATASVLLSGDFSEDQIQFLSSLLGMLREKVAADIAADPKAPPQLAEIFHRFADVVEQTVQKGQLNLGGAVVLAPKSLRFVAGGQVADGRALARTLEELVLLARGEPGVPEIAFRADKHRDVELHTFSVPIPEEEPDARKVLGENLSVVIGTGADSLYLAFGPQCTELLKRVLDRSAELGPQTVSPLQLSISLKPLLEFLTSVGNDPDVARMAAALERTVGLDQFSITVTSIDNGLNCRFEMEQGVWQIIGQASAAE